MGSQSVIRQQKSYFTISTDNHQDKYRDVVDTKAASLVSNYTGILEPAA